MFLKTVNVHPSFLFFLGYIELQMKESIKTGSTSAFMWIPSHPGRPQAAPSLG